MSGADAKRPSRPLGELLADALAIARARLVLRGAALGANVRCRGRLLVRGRSRLSVGARSVFLDGVVPSELRSEGGAISLGESVVVNYGVSVVARHAVTLGARCMLGSFVQIRDDDGRTSGPVVIGDDVWIAHGAVIEPNSTIGDGAVVAACAVVSGAVPARMLAVGNPAQCVPLEGSEPRRKEARAAAPPGATPGAHALPVAAPEAPAPPPASAPAPTPAPAAGVPRPDPAEVRAAIIEWLDDTRHFGEAAGLIRSDHVSLRESGLLDSLGLVQLVLMLEKRYGRALERDLLGQPERQSLAAIVEQTVGPP